MRRRVLADRFDDQRSASAPIVETGEEREVLARLISRLERIEQDPKLNAVIHYKVGGGLRCANPPCASVKEIVQTI